MKAKKQIGIYLFALLPLLSSALYFGMMALGLVEDFNFWGICILLLAVIGWGSVGLFCSHRHVTFFRAALVSHIFPLVCVVAYALMHMIAIFGEMETLATAADIVGLFGMGIFSLFSTMLFAIIPVELFEIYLNFVFYVIVFSAGYAIGFALREKRKKKLSAHTGH